MTSSALRSILVTGAGGQLGTELLRVSWPVAWAIKAVGRTDVDFNDANAVASAVAAGHQGEKFAAVINGAAYTAVDQAESDAVSAWRVNAVAPAALGAACATVGIPLVHVSTDYVFDGKKVGAWEVGDRTCPLNVYGASKLGGELAIRASGARHAIVRTSWVVSAHKSNFVKTMLRLGSERDMISVVADQTGSPTSAADLAKMLAHMTIRLVNDPKAPIGTFHFANSGSTSWAAFATEIFRQSATRGGPAALVSPVTSDNYPTVARRPANSILSNSALVAAYGLQPRRWQDSLSDILNELIGPQL